MKLMAAFVVALAAAVLATWTGGNAASGSSLSRDRVREQHQAQLPSDLKLGPRAEVDGALIYAVYSKDATDQTDYLTLDEAMAAKVASVKENQDTNSLLASNASDRPLFLMAGDLVLGGHQDRILAESVVVDPHTQDQIIPVFCVEHFRSEPQEKDASRVSTEEFYNDAQTGQCDISVKTVALSSRSQEEVWARVAASNDKLGVSSEAPSGTFRGTYDNKDVRAKIEANYARAHQVAVDGMAGFAVFSDGELVAMDVFENRALAHKLSEKLLRSYIITGISGGYAKKPVAVELPQGTPVGFVNEGNHGPESDVVFCEDVGGVPTNLPPPPPTIPTPPPALPGPTQALLGWGGRPIGRAIFHVPAPNSNDSYFAEPGQPPEDPPTWYAEPGSGAVETINVPEDLTGKIDNTAVNGRTQTTREYKKDTLNYTCKDKTTGKSVQRSILRR